MFTFKRRNGLNKPEEFRRVFSYGKKNYKNGLTLVTCKNTEKIARIGFAISKKQIKKAVERNRFKRIAKERFRLQQQALQGLDFIVLVNKTCQNLSNTLINQYFQELFTTAAKQFEPASLP